IGYSVYFMVQILLWISLFVKLFILKMEPISYISEGIIFFLSSGVFSFLMWKRGITLFMVKPNRRKRLIKGAIMMLIFGGVTFIINSFILPNDASILKNAIGSTLGGLLFAFLMLRYDDRLRKRGDKLAGLEDTEEKDI
ncbi:MAG: hypothetical protein PF447_00310, partial [Spirochaetaceae bacterium]|nr:hypothetical protein [Spirochaetaceae bacterium]